MPGTIIGCQPVEAYSNGVHQVKVPDPNRGWMSPCCVSHFALRAGNLRDIGRAEPHNSG
jgi:hypothetical protein